ncbi:MAG TPA: DUF362 domain-containing protein [Chthonomonadaceae bacterium]|nr:DUF362 domain-containing protein [Chthonomonadaceae bacterium]
MIDFKTASTVAAERIPAEYSRHAPFHPDQPYPEYAGPVGTEPNAVYAGVRQLLFDLGLDRDAFGTAAWNPLGALIKPGQQVVLKPNIVLHTNYSGQSVEAVITHGSVIRAVADYALKALQGTGKLIIGDAPVQQCDFAAANRLSGLEGVVAYYRERGLPVALHDFRMVSSAHSVAGVRKASAGDPAGCMRVDLGAASAHADANDHERFRVTNYDPAFMQRHHNATKHEYIIATSVLQADAIISLGKMKTHRKAGISITLKNLVGINGHKDCLPHHKRGSKAEAGDEYLHPSWIKRLTTGVQEIEDVQSSALARLAIKAPKKLLYSLSFALAEDRYSEGSWWGNDTIWRTVIDLNRILFYWDARRGQLADSPQRAFLSLVDGVIAGEGEGPLHPTPRPAGLLLAGLNPVAVDLTAARLMDFDWRKIPTLAQAASIFADFPPEDIHIESADAGLRGLLLQEEQTRYFSFVPPSGWRGHLELKKAAPEGSMKG